MTEQFPIDFWFDFSSPYSYLASERFDELAAKYGRKVKWRPVMLGAAFKASGLPLLLTVPLKGEYSKRDIPDPYRQPEQAFRQCLQLIDQEVREWLQRIDKI